MTTPVERLLAKLPDAKQVGKGWSARCPAHEDRRASLSIAEGDDGRVLLKCHAGCKADEICAAVGLRVVDLMPTADTLPVNSVSVNDIRRTPKKTGIPLTPNRKPAGKTFASAGDAVTELERRHGPQSALWTYHDAHGEPVGVVVRWDLSNGKKDIRPSSRHGDGWRIGGMPVPRPLYCLPDMAGAKRVYVCEGEKAADAVRSIGLAATTSAHGCESPGKADWRPLAGKEIIILPDNDPPGRKYADTVTALLAKLTPAPVVKLVELSGLPDHGDAADFVAAHAGTNADELRRIVEALADDAEAIEAEQPLDRIGRFQPFPNHVLPDRLAEFVDVAATAIGCDPAFVILPLLSVLASSIGNSRVLLLKRGWTAPAILWTVCIGESGSQKSPPFRLVLKPLRALQQYAIRQMADAIEKFERDKVQYEAALLKWKRKPNGDPPDKPTPPPSPRMVVSDATVEAMASVLQDNPRGVLLACDELNGWLSGFDRYKKAGGGSDCSHWLSMHNGETMIVDRKTGQRLTIVPAASVSIAGGIQPAILARALQGPLRENGLAARLLMTFPPVKQKRWTNADVRPEQLAIVESVIDQLLTLEPNVDENDDPEPVLVRLSPEARQLFVEYYNDHAAEQSRLTGDLASTWSKLEEAAARLALVHHLVRWALGENVDVNIVDQSSMAAGIVMARWFGAEAKRVYFLLDETDEDRDQRRLVEWIDRRGGSVTAREVQMGCRWLRDAGAAEAALDELAKAGWGTWEPTPPGRPGQPTRHLRLSTPSTVNGNSALSGENGNTVDVDAVDAPETQPDDDRGYL